MNLSCYGRKVGPNDEIIITEAEHHSNLMPWQQLCLQTKATLRVIPFDENGRLDMEGYRVMLSEKTKLVAVCHVSNVFGTINREVQRKFLAGEF